MKSLTYLAYESMFQDIWSNIKFATKFLLNVCNKLLIKRKISSGLTKIILKNINCCLHFIYFYSKPFVIIDIMCINNMLIVVRKGLMAATSVRYRFFFFFLFQNVRKIDMDVLVVYIAGTHDF